MANLRRVQDMVAVVTGAATGIGFASSKALLEEGATVLMTDIDESNLNRSYKELSALGLSVSSSLLDVTDENAWQVIMDRVIKDYGRLDILLNNAGVVSHSLLKDQDMDAYQRIVDINVNGVFLGSKSAILTMRANAGDSSPKGSIINMSSIGGQRAIQTVGAYCTSKAAVANLTKALAIECAEKREFIRVNSIHPGNTKTSMTETIYGNDYFKDEANYKSVPLGGHGIPEDVAEAVVYLASDEARMVTGSELTIDGGLSAILAGRN